MMPFDIKYSMIHAECRFIAGVFLLAVFQIAIPSLAVDGKTTDAPSRQPTITHAHDAGETKAVSSGDETGSKKKKSSRTWKSTLDTRFRFESTDGFTKKSLTGAIDNFLLGRFVLRLSRTFENGVTARIGIKEGRVWGLDEPNDVFFSKNLGLVNHPYQDVAELEETGFLIPVKLSGNGKGNLNIGRQKISMGNGRVFGPGEFGNTGRYIWDALKFTLKTGKASHILFYGRNKAHHPERFSLTHRHQTEGAGIYSSIPLESEWVVEPFLVGKWDRRTVYASELAGKAELHQYYLGLRCCHLPKNGVLFDGTWVRQTGHCGGDGVDALGWLGQVGYRWAKRKFKPEVSLEYSYASGDRDPKDGSLNRFDGVFGGIDKSFGRLGLSTWSNITDLQHNLSWSAGEVRVTLEHHRLGLASDRDAWQLNPSKYRDTSGNSGNEIGKVFNVLLSDKSVCGCETTLGSAFFMPGAFAAKLTGRPQQATWIYLEISRAFSL